MCVIKFYFSGTDNMSKIFHLVSEEGAIIYFKLHVGLGDGVEDFIKITDVFQHGVRIDGYVIYVEETVLTVEMGQNHVYPRLTCWLCVS